MPLTALPGQAPGPQSTDQVLPSWLTYVPTATITRTFTSTLQTVLYDPAGSLAPTVSVSVQVGVTTDTLYAARPLPLAYTGPSPYPPLGTLFTIPGQGQAGSGTGSASGSGSAGGGIPSATATSGGGGQNGGGGGSSGSGPTPTPAPAPSSSAGGSGGGGNGQNGGGGSGGSSGPGPTPAPGPAPSSNGGSGTNTGGSNGGGSSNGGVNSATVISGTTFFPGSTSVVSGTTFLSGATSIVSDTTFLPGSTSLISGSTLLPGSTTIFDGTTIIAGTSTIINGGSTPGPGPTSTTTAPPGTPLGRQSGGLTPAQLAGTLVASIGGLLLLIALLLCVLLRQRRAERRRARQGLVPGPTSEKFAGYGDASAAGAGGGYGASNVGHPAGEKSALLGAGAAGAGATAAGEPRRPSGWTSWFTSRGNRMPSDSATGGTYTALPHSNLANRSAMRGHDRHPSGGSALSAGLAGASAAAVAAMAAISSHRRRRREEGLGTGTAGAYGARKGAVCEDEWEADELDDDGGSGFFVVGGRRPDEYERRRLVVDENLFADSGEGEGEYYHDGGSSQAHRHHAQGVAAAAGAAVIAAGRGRSIPPSTSSLLVHDPAKDSRKGKYRAMANLGVGGGGGGPGGGDGSGAGGAASGPRFFGAMMGTRSTSGTESGTGSNSNSGPSQRNVSATTSKTPATVTTTTTQPSVRSVSGGQVYATPPESVPGSSVSGYGSGMMLGIGAAAGAAATGLAQVARRISSGDRRLSRKPVNYYTSSGTDTEAEDPLSASDYLGKKRKRTARDGGQLYGAVGTGPVGEEDEDEDEELGRGERARLYDVSEGWPDTALVGAAAGALAGSSASASRRAHRRTQVQNGEMAHLSSGDGSGNASAPWSSGSTHEVPKSSSGVLLTASSTGHRSGSADESGGGGGGGGVTALSPRPRPGRSRASTTGSPADAVNVATFANVAASSPQDRARLVAFPEVGNNGDASHSVAPPSSRIEITPSSPDHGTSLSGGADLAALTAAGTGGALGLLAARHRSSTMTSSNNAHLQGADRSSTSEDNSQNVAGTPDEVPGRHSDFLSRGTHLLGPGASTSSRSSLVSAGNQAGETDPAESSVGSPPPSQDQSANSTNVGGVGGSSGGLVDEFGNKAPHRSKSRNTLGSRQLSTIFGSESEPSSASGGGGGDRAAHAPSLRRVGTMGSGSGSGGSGAGVDPAFDSLGRRSGSPSVGMGGAALAGLGAGAAVGAGSTYVRSARYSNASEARVPTSLLGTMQRGGRDLDYDRVQDGTTSPAGTFGNAELASPPGSPHRNSVVGSTAGGIRLVGPSATSQSQVQSARASRSPTPGGQATPARTRDGVVGADGEGGPASPADVDLEAAQTDDSGDDDENAAAQTSAEGGLLSSVAAGLRRWIPGASSRPNEAVERTPRRPSIGGATMGILTAVGTAAGSPTSGDGGTHAASRSPEALSPATSSRPDRQGSGGTTGSAGVGSGASSLSSAQQPGADNARLSMATSRAVAGSREGSGSGSGSDPSAIHDRSLSSVSGSGGEPRSPGLDSVSYRTHHTSSHGTSGRRSGHSGSGSGTGSGSGRGSQRSAGAQSRSGPSLGGVDESEPAQVALSTTRPTEPHPVLPAGTIRLVNPLPARARAQAQAQAGARAHGASSSSSSQDSAGSVGSASSAWRQSPRVATVSQRAVEAEAARARETARSSPCPQGRDEVQVPPPARIGGEGRHSPTRGAQAGQAALGPADPSSSASGSNTNRPSSQTRSPTAATTTAATTTTTGGSPDEFEWGALADTFPTPLDRALREAEQRDLEEQAQGRARARYEWPKFLRF